jgi:DNA invertase Pin-like site-specific DNA recombinase
MNESYTYGYARVSTQQQDLNRQIDQLEQYNCREILTEKMSGTKSDSPGGIRNILYKN